MFGLAWLIVCFTLLLHQSPLEYYSWITWFSYMAESISIAFDERSLSVTLYEKSLFEYCNYIHTGSAHYSSPPAPKVQSPLWHTSPIRWIRRRRNTDSETTGSDCVNVPFLVPSKEENLGNKNGSSIYWMSRSVYCNGMLFGRNG